MDHLTIYDICVCVSVCILRQYLLSQILWLFKCGDLKNVKRLGAYNAFVKPI